MKTFSEIVKKYAALSGTKGMAQWSVGMALDLHLHKKWFNEQMAIQDEMARRKG